MRDRGPTFKPSQHVARPTQVTFPLRAIITSYIILMLSVQEGSLKKLYCPWQMGQDLDTSFPDREGGMRWGSQYKLDADTRAHTNERTDGPTGMGSRDYEQPFR